MIFRRGKWDLPKGKLDKGEKIEDCAVREVEEETGLKNVKLNSLLSYLPYLSRRNIFSKGKSLVYDDGNGRPNVNSPNRRRYS